MAGPNRGVDPLVVDQNPQRGTVPGRPHPHHGRLAVLRPPRRRLLRFNVLAHPSSVGPAASRGTRRTNPNDLQQQKFRHPARSTSRGRTPTSSRKPPPLAPRASHTGTVTSWLNRRFLQLWTYLHRTFDSADPATKWTSRAIWALLTLGACTVLGHATTWASQFAGASENLTALLGVLVAFTAFVVALTVVSTGPGHARRPALIALVATPCLFLLMMQPWR